SCRHQQMQIILKPADRNDTSDFFFRLERQDVGDGPAGAGAAHLRDVINLEPIHLAAIRETKKISVRRGYVKMLDEVVLARSTPGYAFAAPVLTTISVERKPFDIAVVADGHGVD